MFESPWHWLVVAIVAFVLFFGWKQLPDMARSLGRSLRIFKTEIKGMTEDDKKRAAADEAQADRPRALPSAQVIPNDAPNSRPRPSPQRASNDAPGSGASS